jgi:general stress protein CsbA
MVSSNRKNYLPHIFFASISIVSTAGFILFLTRVKNAEQQEEDYDYYLFHILLKKNNTGVENHIIINILIFISVISGKFVYNYQSYTYIIFLMLPSLSERLI